MKKIEMVVADDNMEYLKHLATFIRTSSDASMLITTFFSNQNNLQLYFNKKETIDVLLISRNLFNKDLSVDPQTTVILLEEDEFSDEDQYPFVYRYQRLNQLISNILDIYYEPNQAAKKELISKKQTQVIGCYSPIGGSGKTTIATNFCKQLVANQKKVLYLNLELFNTSSLFFSSGEDRSSLQFQDIKDDLEELQRKIKHDHNTSVEYIDLGVNPNEMLAIPEQEIIQLIKSIVAIKSYDYLVIDLDSSVHEQNIAVLKNCNHIIWPIANDVQSVLKTKSFFDFSNVIGDLNNIQDKLLIVLNKYENTIKDRSEDLDIPVAGYLPFISDWLTVNSGFELLDNDDFSQATQAIIQKHLLQDKEIITNDG